MRQFAHLLCILLASTLISCSLPLGEARTASFTLTLPTSRVQAQIPGNDFSAVTKWNITGNGPDGAGFAQDVDVVSNTFSMSGLAIGTWNITITAFGSSKTILFLKTITAALVAGPNQLTVVMDPFIGANPFSSGSGTPADPFVVTNAAQLYEVRNYLSSSFVQAYDIDLSMYSNWIPIGDSSAPFTGSYSGVYQGVRHKIKNLTINASGIDQVGLFGHISGTSSSSLTGITLEGVDITASNQVAGLVGYSGTGLIVINQCSVSGTIRGTGYVGALVGWADSGTTLQESYSDADIEGVGGSASALGGLVGFARSTNSTQPVSLSDVFFVGRVLNVNSDGGGLIGLAQPNAPGFVEITNSYASASMSVSTYGGGLVGYASGSVISTNSCYNSQKSGYGTSVVSETPFQASAMTQVSTFSTWNVGPIWKIDQDFCTPYFTWMTAPLRVSPYHTGLGTIASPYLVATPLQLDAVRYYPASHFRQTSNIDMGVTPYNSGTGWTPIGTTNGSGVSEPFHGSYDGQAFEIQNLYSDQSASGLDTGLFGRVEPKAEAGTITDGILKNIYLVNVNILSGSGYAGGLAGSISDMNDVLSFSNPTVYNCHVSGVMSGSSIAMGGLVGDARVSHTGHGMLVSWSYSTVSLTPSGNYYYGGLIGNAAVVRLYRDYYSGTINAPNGGTVSGGVGGLVGWASFSDPILVGIEECYANAIVTGKNNVGGLVGYALNSNVDSFLIRNSYSVGTVTAITQNAGGFIGNSSGVAIDHSWTSSTVVAPTGLGGFVGVNSGSTFGTGTLYDSTTSGLSGGYGTAVPITTLQSPSLMSGTYGFGGVWSLSPGVLPTFPW